VPGTLTEANEQRERQAKRRVRAARSEGAGAGAASPSRDLGIRDLGIRDLAYATWHNGSTQSLRLARGNFKKSERPIVCGA
jgi:hypothetical protein